MSGAWLTYSKRKDNEFKKLCEKARQRNDGLDEEYQLTEEEIKNRAWDELNKFEEEQWTRAILCEIRYEKLREKLREEHGLSSTSAKKEKLKGFSFITFNPPADLTLPEVVEATKEIAQEFAEEKELFECSFEQRGERTEDIGKGKHVHMIIKNSKYPSAGYKQKMIQDINKTLQQFANKKKKKINRTCIDYRPIGDNETLEIKQQYIRGVKKDEKLTKVDFDKPFRERYKIPDVLDYHTLETLKVSEPPLQVHGRHNIHNILTFN